MTSVLPGEDGNTMKMKQKLINDGRAKEEARSFLNFSRENLSISDLEQGFNRSRLRPRINMIISVAALTIALLCFCLEIWRISCSSHEMEQIKMDIESLKHRLVQQNLVDEMKAFHEQFYGDESIENDDPGETDIDNADYDSNYDDDSSASHDYSGDYHAPLTYGSRSSDFPEITSTSVPIPTPPNPSSNKDILQLLAAFRKVEAEHGQDFEKNMRENHKNIEREHLKEEHKVRVSHGEKINNANSTKHERDILARDVTSMESASQKSEEGVKSKRSVSERAVMDLSTDKSSYQRDNRHHARRTIVSRTHPYTNGESKTNDDHGINTAIDLTTHPPKKYYAHARLEASSTMHDDQLSEEIAWPNGRTNEETEESVGGGRRVSWRYARHDAIGNRSDNGTEIRGPAQDFEVSMAAYGRRLVRRHLRAPRQVYAIHYGADSTLFASEDEHTGNGRARHNNGIFKAWRPSNWVAELGMNRHFVLAADGKLTVHEPGLYLVYAQIHYLDEHDENGFHLLVNGRPILQCMVYSPGAGHKSRSCFSAQVTFLQASDQLILKDVGSARYTLFQHDKSFFGLVKLGEHRQQQRHQPTTS